MLIDEVYKIIADDKVVPKLTIHPGKSSTVGDGDKYLYQDGELVLFKDTLKEIFVESYQAHNVKGLLLTTNMNTTVMNQIPLAHGLLEVREQMKYISCLLRCNLRKINKSSSLWLLMARLVTLDLSLKETVLVESVEFILDTLFQSAENHRSNYYCWQFMRYFINLLCIITESNMTLSQSIELIISRTQRYLFQNVTDHSVWQFLSYCYRFRGIDPFEYSMYRDHCRILALTPVSMSQDIRELLESAINEKGGVEEVVNFINRSNTISYIPFEFLIPFEVPNKFWDSITIFESKYQGSISIINGYYSFKPATPTDDLSFMEQLKINGNKKRLKMWKN